MLVFFDISAFVKRYVGEAGTDAVLEWCDRATEIGFSAIDLPEIISAFFGYAVRPGLPTRDIGK